MKGHITGRTAIAKFHDLIEYANEVRDARKELRAKWVDWSGHFEGEDADVAMNLKELESRLRRRAAVDLGNVIAPVRDQEAKEAHADKLDDAMEKCRQSAKEDA